MLSAQGGDRGDDQSCTSGLGKGSKQVGTHTSNVSDVVTNIVCKQQKLSQCKQGEGGMVMTVTAIQAYPMQLMSDAVSGMCGRGNTGYNTSGSPDMLSELLGDLQV